jgi:uncharacterized membrane protein (DUF106 family)
MAAAAKTGGGASTGAPTPGASWSRFATIFILILAIFVLFDNNLRTALGTAVGYVLNPLVGFNFQYPVLTLFITGILMTGLTVLVRHFFTDYVEQAENQKIIGAFNQELRKARQSNNTYKTKKLMEQQQAIMQRSLKSSATQLKLLPATMIIVIPIFAWVAVFMANANSPIISVPWSASVDLLALNIFPNWVLLYSLVSIPFGQILARALRWYDFRKRLREIEANEGVAAA